MEVCSFVLCLALPEQHLMKILHQLFKDVTPKTAENFRQFCTGETKNSQGRPLGYKSCKFHRVVRITLQSTSLPTD